MGCGNSTMPSTYVSNTLTSQDSSWDVMGSEVESPLLFICDDKGIILDCNENVTKHLLFKREALMGEFIGVIMTPHMRMLHREMFIKNYKQASKMVRNSMDIKLSAKSKHRPLLIYDVNGKPVFVNLSLTSNPPDHYRQNPGALPLPPDSEYYFRLSATVRTSQDESIYVYTDSMEDLAKKQQGFSLSKNNIVIICIDFMRSTELLEAKGPMNMAFINKRFYDDIVHIITHHFYPYISVHEVVGDSFVLVLNADWTYNLQSYCATLAINFVNRLWRASADYVDMRVGISYGKVMYGFIGPTLRFFGNPMHVASRLESQGDRGKALCNDEFFEKLREEVSVFGTNISNILQSAAVKETMMLKGYGDRECHRISLSSSREDFIEIPNQ